MNFTNLERLQELKAKYEADKQAGRISPDKFSEIEARFSRLESGLSGLGKIPEEMLDSVKKFAQETYPVPVKVSIHDDFLFVDDENKKVIGQIDLRDNRIMKGQGDLFTGKIETDEYLQYTEKLLDYIKNGHKIIRYIPDKNQESLWGLGRTSKDELSTINDDLLTLLKINDYDKLKKEKEKFSDIYRKLTEKEKQKLPAIQNVMQWEIELFFKKFPTFEDYYKYDRDILYEDSMGRKTKSTYDQIKQWYDIMLKRAENYNANIDKNIANQVDKRTELLARLEKLGNRLSKVHDKEKFNNLSKLMIKVGDLLDDHSIVNQILKIGNNKFKASDLEKNIQTSKEETEREQFINEFIDMFKEMDEETIKENTQEAEEYENISPEEIENYKKRIKQDRLKQAENFYDDIINKGEMPYKYFYNNTGNNTSQKIFEKYTGIKLGKTNAEHEKGLRQFYGEEWWQNRKANEESEYNKRKELDAKAAEDRLIKEDTNHKVKWGDEIFDNFRIFIDKIIEQGYNKLEITKTGIKKSYELHHPDKKNYAFFDKKGQWLYIDRKLAELKNAVRKIEIVYGNADEIITSSEKIPARYGVMELDDVIPSNNAFTFAPEKKYPAQCQTRNYKDVKGEQEKVANYASNFNAKLLLTDSPTAVDGPPIVTTDGYVIGGNGRAMVLKRVAEKGNYENEYTKYLKYKLEWYGIGDISQFKQPVLVRVIDVELKYCNRYSNILNSSMMQEYDEVTEGIALARQLDENKWALDAIANILEESEAESFTEIIKTSSIYKELIKILKEINIINPQNSNLWLSDNKFSNKGELLLENILIAAVLPDKKLLTKVTKYKNKLLKAIPLILRMKQLPKGWNLIPEIEEAIKLESDREKQNISRKEFIDQIGFDKPAIPEKTQLVWKTLDADVSILRNFLSHYIEAAINLSSGDAMFEQNQSALDVLREFVEKRDLKGLDFAVWHGSPHSFDKFTTEKIGTGEGQQVYGWGLYFTDKKDIAEWYADKLGICKYGLYYNDKFITEAKGINLSYLRTNINDKNESLFMGNLKSMLRYMYTPEEKQILDIEKKLNDIQKQKKYKFKNFIIKGYDCTNHNLYKAKVFGDKDVNDLNFLDWDKSVEGKNKEMIKTHLKKESIYKYPVFNENDYKIIKDFKYNPNDIDELSRMQFLSSEDNVDKYFHKNIDNYVDKLNNQIHNIFIDRSFTSGSKIYHRLSDSDFAFDNDKEASLFLLRAGIDGIKYCTGDTRYNKCDAYNYVIFDENAVEIEEHQLYGLGALPISKAKEYTKAWKEYGTDKLYDEYFKGKYRIYLPIKELDKKLDCLDSSDNYTLVRSWLMDNGYSYTDGSYIQGYCYKNDKNGKSIQYRIGKVLNSDKNDSEAQRLLKLFNEDKCRSLKSDSKYFAVISRHPYDVAGMSTDRGWNSCMTLPTEKIKTKHPKYKIEFEEVESSKIDKEDGALRQINYIFYNKMNDKIKIASLYLMVNHSDKRNFFGFFTIPVYFNEINKKYSYYSNHSFEKEINDTLEWITFHFVYNHQENEQGGCNMHYVYRDVVEGTLIAYLIKENDKNIEHPLGRVLIKPLKRDDNIFLAVEGKAYGTIIPEFLTTVQEWVDKYNENAPKGLYKLPENLYQDDIEIIHKVDGLAEKTQGKFNDEFWKWFGDSKVVDEKGKPKIVYHGTDRKFDTFKMIEAELGKGAYFTDDKKWAKEFGKYLMPVYLSIQNPQYVTGYYEEYNFIPGHDGIIRQESKSAPYEYVVYSPNQIKSVDNDGSWDKNDNSILSGLSGYVSENTEYRIKNTEEIPATDNRQLTNDNEQPTTDVVSIADVKKLPQPKPLKLNRTALLFGTMYPRIKILIKGSAGKGKSTFALLLADDWAANGRVLYILSEERLDASRVTSRVNLVKVKNPNIDFLEVSPFNTDGTTNAKKIIDTINTGNYQFIIIDSVTMLEKFGIISQDELVNIIMEFPEISFALIVQMTKDNRTHAGKSIWTYIPDTVVEVDEGVALTEKHRDGPNLKTMSIFPGAVYQYRKTLNIK